MADMGRSVSHMGMLPYLSDGKIFQNSGYGKKSVSHLWECYHSCQMGKFFKMADMGKSVSHIGMGMVLCQKGKKLPNSQRKSLPALRWFSDKKKIFTCQFIFIR